MGFFKNFVTSVATDVIDNVQRRTENIELEKEKLYNLSDKQLHQIAVTAGKREKRLAAKAILDKRRRERDEY